MKNIYYEKLGKTIRGTREAAEVSRQELAEALGKKSATFIALIEAGERKVSIYNLEEIANYLHKPLDHFLNKRSKKKNHVPVEVILRADENLRKPQQEQILDFISFIKRNKK